MSELTFVYPYPEDAIVYRCSGGNHGRNVFFRRTTRDCPNEYFAWCQDCYKYKIHNLIELRSAGPLGSTLVTFKQGNPDRGYSTFRL